MASNKVIDLISARLARLEAPRAAHLDVDGLARSVRKALDRIHAKQAAGRVLKPSELNLLAMEARYGRS